MKQSIRDKLEQLAARLAELDREFASADAARDMETFRTRGRERAEIEPVVSLYAAFCQAEADGRSARAMLDDPEMRELAPKCASLPSSRSPSRANVPRRSNASSSARCCRVIPMTSATCSSSRAGTGGEEAALFAGDLLRMYTRYAERQRWKVELVSSSESELGGYKEIIARVVGNGAYSRLKFESGGHRVQRIPVTETQGRIHTSACTVAVMPEADELEAVAINPADRDQPGRSAGRHLPRQRRRRAAHQQDRFGGAYHPPAHRHRGRVPGRPLATSQPRPGDVGARRPHP